MKSKLDYIESRLEALIENRFTWLPWQNLQPRLARQIVEALRSNVFLEIEENQVLPNLIIFSMNPDNLSAWEANQDWLTWLAQAIQESIVEAGATIIAPPIIRLQSDPFLTQDELTINAEYPMKDLGSTAAMPGFKMFSESQPASASLNTYLILRNEDIFPINQPVVNIGRRPENQLILEDLRVSRDHAQIRKIQGQHVLFDLNSTGGTFVNGKRISQYTLRTGDVISFAGVTVIFAEDITDQHSHTATSPAQP
jgi:hypothetical protein